MGALGGVALALDGIFVAMLSATGRLGNVWQAILGRSGGGGFTPGGGGGFRTGASGSFAPAPAGQNILSGGPSNSSNALLNASTLGVPAVPGLTGSGAIGLG